MQDCQEIENPIELVWAPVKDFVAACNISFNMIE